VGEGPDQYRDGRSHPFYAGLGAEVIDFAKAKFEQEQGLSKEDPEPLSFEALYLWELFEDLYDPSGGGFGPTLLSYGEIYAYAALMDRRLQQWEVVTLRQVSRWYLSAYSRKHDRQTNKHPNLTNLVSMKDSEGLKSIFRRAGQDKPKRPTVSTPKKRN
jgi:hypothetical protein